MSEGQSPIVASLKNRSPHPYSSIALSPSRQHAVAAAKDTLTVLSVRPSGLSEIRSLRVSQVSRLMCVYLLSEDIRRTSRYFDLVSNFKRQWRQPTLQQDPVGAET
jgi:hypothetical protein